MSDSGSVVQTRQLAIQEADELDAAVVDEAGADERLAEDRVGLTLDDLRLAVNTLEDAERIARRVLGTAHPVASGIERELQKCRAALAAVEQLDVLESFLDLLRENWGC